MVAIIHANISDTPITSSQRTVSLLPANSKPLEHALASITAKIEPIPVPFETIWDIDACPDSYLPFLAYAWSVDEWNDMWTPDTQRAVIKSSLWVHQRKGTLGAVKRALSAMGYDALVIEWFEKSPRGTPGTFSIEVHPTTGIITDSLRQIRAVVDAVKRLSAHYDIYLGYTIRGTARAIGVPCLGINVTLST